MFLFDLLLLWGVNAIAKASGIEEEKTVIFDNFLGDQEGSREVPYYSSSNDDHHDGEYFSEGEW